MFKIIVLAVLTAVLPVGCDASPEQEKHEENTEQVRQESMTVEPQQEEVSRPQQVSCWPLRHFRYSRDRVGGGWLAPRYRDSRHLGVDMFAPIGSPVLAIADGVVHEISWGGWGPGNVALMIKHQLDDGRWFIALYGHIRNLNGLRRGGTVRACSVIGAVGPYRRGSHLHFGVIAPGKLPRAPYGTSKRSDRNDFIDPVRFLRSFSGSPEGGAVLVRTQEESRPASAKVASRAESVRRGKVVAAPVVQEKPRPAHRQGRVKKLQTGSKTAVHQAAEPVKVSSSSRFEESVRRGKVVAAPVVQEVSRAVKQLQASSKIAVSQSETSAPASIQAEKKKRKPAENGQSGKKTLLTTTSRQKESLPSLTEQSKRNVSARKQP